MKTMQKLSIMMLLFCLIISSMINNSKAINLEKSILLNTVNIYEGLTYDGKNFDIPIAVARSAEGEIPIYALKQEGYYLNGSLSYYTEQIEVLQNDAIRNILLLGYPHTSFQELECSNQEEAYVITQIAILNEYYHYDFSKFLEKNTNQYLGIITKIENLIQSAQESQQTKRIPEITIKAKENEWKRQEEPNNLSKTYEVTANIEFEDYTIQIEGRDANKVQIKNSQNELQSTFLAGETFEIWIPKEESLEFEIVIKTQVETVPVKMAKGPADTWESYVFLEQKEEIESRLQQKYEKVQLEEEKNEQEEKIPKPEENENTNHKIEQPSIPTIRPIVGACGGGANQEEDGNEEPEKKPDDNEEAEKKPENSGEIEEKAENSEETENKPEQNENIDTKLDENANANQNTNNTLNKKQESSKEKKLPRTGC